MKLMIEIELDNDAFAYTGEVGTILHGIATDCNRAEMLIDEPFSGIVSSTRSEYNKKIKDSNGNTVGKAWVEND